MSRRRTVREPIDLPPGAKSLGINLDALPQAPVVRRAIRPAKYHAEPTIYDGVRYASKLEAARARTLDLLIASGEVRWWIGQPTFRLGCPENVYRADMIVVMHDGSVHVEECKGFETRKFARDLKLWASYGPCELWIIKRHGIEVIKGGPRIRRSAFHRDVKGDGWMDLNEFSRKNRDRCESPDGFNHQLGDWSLSDWMTAIMGEIGEAANVVKKLNRVRDGVPGNDEAESELRAKLARELADTFIYLDLTFQRLGLDLGTVVTEVFNAKSDKIGSLVKL